MKTKKPSAGARIKANGKSLVWVTFNEQEKRKIRVASAQKGQPMSQFLKDAGLRAAEKTLKNLPEFAD